MINIITSPMLQQILFFLATIAGIAFFVLDHRMGEKDERINLLNQKGTNFVLWTFCFLIFVLFLINPSEALVYRKFIANAFFLSIIIGSVYAFYQYRTN